MRFSAIKKAYPKMHIQPTKGSKEQAEDYINKRGKWEEKGEEIVFIEKHGELKGFQGKRNDLDEIERLIEEGVSPRDIMSVSIRYRKYEKAIKDAYFEKKRKEIPFQRELKAYWHVGLSGSGKSFTATKLIDEFGEDEVYFLTDCDNGGFDLYSGEKILFMDEFRGQIKFHVLLNSILSPYRSQVHSRYANIWSLWNEVHITSVLPPELVYAKMVEDNRQLDSFEQLKRRIKYIVYHWKDSAGKYYEFNMPMEEYTDYETLKAIAESSVFEELPDDTYIPFENDNLGKEVKACLKNILM